MKNSWNSNKKRRVSVTQKNRGRGGLRTHPPQIGNYQIIHERTLRFTAVAAAASTNITFADILDCIGIATTAIAGYELFDLVRIKRLDVWGIASLGTPSTISVVYSGTTAGSVGDVSLHTDTSLGFEPAFVSARPGGRSLASMFQPYTAGTAFTITCPAGAVVDLHVTFRDVPGEGTALQAALVGATVGSIFYRGLDGAAIAGTNFKPPAGVVQL